MIGQRLRQRRSELGLTQQQVADKIGAKKNTISNYECNVCSPSEKTLMQLMELLQCDANYLFGDCFKETDQLVLTKDEKVIINAYRSFNEEGKEKVRKEISDMQMLPHYKKRDENDVVKKEA